MQGYKIKIYSYSKAIFLIVISLQFFSSKANQNKFEQEYFRKLKNMQYDEARLHLNLNYSGNIENREKFLFLITILETRRQDSLVFQFKDEDSKVLDYLIQGYLELFKERYSSSSAYEAFSKALSLSSGFEEKESLKFTLISILEVLRKEIFIGSRQYRFYLDYYADLSESIEDEIIHNYFEIVFASKADIDLRSETSYEKRLEKLEKLFYQVQNSNGYFPFFCYEKAIYFKLNERYKESINWLNKGLDLCNKPHLEKLKNTLFWQLADLNLKLKNYDKSFYFLNKSEELSNDMRDEFYNHRLKSWIYEEKEEFDSAYYYLKSSVDLEYRLGAKNNSLETAVRAIENETDKLKLDKEISENKRRANRNWLIAASLALLLGTGIAVLLQKNTAKKRQLAEQEALLKQQRVDNLLKEQELVSIDAMIAGQEKERQKVAGELHDDLGSLMATIKLHFDNSQVGKKDPALINAQKLLEEAYQKIRGMAHSRNSGVMSDQGLLSAIKKMSKAITETNALEVTVEDFGLGERLENTLELSVFRMVQELVANAIKHAEASKVTIQLTQHEDNLNIIVEDNGKGFDRSQLDKNKRGMGLTNIEKRVEHLEGSFTVDSILGKGTSILIDIPV